MDRIDLWISVEAVSSHALHTTQRKPEPFPVHEIIPNILKARKLQHHRTGSSIRYNAHLTAEETATLAMTSECRELIIHAGEHYHLSPRAQHRLIKVARTIADLTSAEVIEKEHLLEALQYRNLQ
jgi:magnesium chelatase family protein